VTRTRLTTTACPHQEQALEAYEKLMRSQPDLFKPRRHRPVVREMQRAARHTRADTTVAYDQSDLSFHRDPTFVLMTATAG